MLAFRTLETVDHSTSSHFLQQMICVMIGLAFKAVRIPCVDSSVGKEALFAAIHADRSVA